MRPRSLAEVAELVLNGESFDFSLSNFLDEFYARPREEMMVQEPRWLGTVLGELGMIEDAYLAATAEALCQRYDLRLPAWVLHGERALRRPWFASSLASLRAVLIQESPAAFRARNLFVSENALSRA